MRGWTTVLEQEDGGGRACVAVGWANGEVQCLVPRRITHRYFLFVFL